VIGMDLPRVKVHEDGRIAVQLEANRWEIAHPPGRLGTRDDGYVSRPGWRDAAIVLLSSPVRHGPGWGVWAGGVHASHTAIWATGRAQLLGPDGARQLASALVSAAAWHEQRATTGGGDG
jgi:hypothetical protein